MPYLILSIISTIYCVVSVVVFLYYFFNPPARYLFLKKNYFWWGGLIVFGMFLTCYGVLYIGIKHCLWFIPEQWGRAVALRDTIASLIGTGAAVFLGWLFYAFAKMREEYLLLKLICEMEGEKKKFEYLTENRLKDKIEEFEQRRKKLDGNLSDLQCEEVTWLNELLTDLKGRLNTLEKQKY